MCKTQDSVGVRPVSNSESLKTCPANSFSWSAVNVTLRANRTVLLLLTYMHSRNVDSAILQALPTSRIDRPDFTALISASNC
jgi:hypothetical protein